MTHPSYDPALPLSEMRSGHNQMKIGLDRLSSAIAALPTLAITCHTDILPSKLALLSHPTLRTRDVRRQFFFPSTLFLFTTADLGLKSFSSLGKLRHYQFSSPCTYLVLTSRDLRGPSPVLPRTASPTQTPTDEVKAKAKAHSPSFRLLKCNLSLML
jgi:hypothetical protein